MDETSCVNAVAGRGVHSKRRGVAGETWFPLRDGATGMEAGRGGRMSVLDYQLGRHPGAPARPRVPVDPITMRVLGGAFHAVAKEMAGVLFRMSYSSIIRESKDLGAGIFDAEGREICESDTTPL